MSRTNSIQRRTVVIRARYAPFHRPVQNQRRTLGTRGGVVHRLRLELARHPEGEWIRYLDFRHDVNDARKQVSELSRVIAQARTDLLKAAMQNGLRKADHVDPSLTPGTIDPQRIISLSREVEQVLTRLEMELAPLFSQARSLIIAGLSSNNESQRRERNLKPIGQEFSASEVDLLKEHLPESLIAALRTVLKEQEVLSEAFSRLRNIQFQADVVRAGFQANAAFVVDDSFQAQAERN